MKLMFISDIHGSEKYLNLAIENIKKENPDQIVLLGDLLYHGPRNPLPEGYNPANVASKLNEYKEKIIAVQGNCDSYVDQMIIDFPIMSQYSIIYTGRKIFATHGHEYNLENLPPLNDGDIIIHGHTHIPVAEKIENIYLLNPGSISLPKNGTPNTYGIMEDNRFEVKTLDGNVYKCVEFEN